MLVDDHDVVREGVVAHLIEAFGLGTRIFHAPNLDKALAVVAANPGLDVALIDLFLRNDDDATAGFAGIAAFGLACPRLPIVILSASDNPSDVQRALACGAIGYVPRSASPATLKAALDLVLKGELYVPALMSAGPLATATAAPVPLHRVRLTSRQTEVLGLIGEGLSNKEIARSLFISDKTVKAHITSIFKAIGVSNRTQAARLARTLGHTPMKGIP